VEPKAELVHREILWNNRFILIDKRPAYKGYERWCSKGVIHLSDIFFNGHIMTIAELENKLHLGKINFMAYNSITHAIPSRWKNAMSNMNNYAQLNIDTDDCCFTINNDVVSLNRLTCNNIYWAITNNAREPPVAIGKWIEEFPFLHDNDFCKFFALPYKIVTGTQLQTFQYKILTKTSASRSNLKKWKIVESAACTFCGELYTITHMFYRCTLCTNFWKQVQNWIRNSLQVTFNLSIIDILFGIPFANDQNLLHLNLIILHGKWFIFKQHQQELQGDLSLYNFLRHLKHNVELEYQIESFKTDSKALNKWENVLSSI
jgi:hypothetical protein